MRIFFIVVLFIFTFPVSMVIILIYLLYGKKSTIVVTTTTNAKGETTSTVVTNAIEPEKQTKKINIGDRDYWSLAVSNHQSDN